jgi:hypothetical protein
MGTGYFPGVKRPGRGVDHPPPSSTEVNVRAVLYPYSYSGYCKVIFTFTFTFYGIKIFIKLRRILRAV